MDHVYTQEVTILLPVACPATFDKDDPVTLRLTAHWLACKDVCLPGDASLAVSFPASSRTTEATSRRFREARERLPVRVPDPAQSGIRLVATADRVHIEVAGARSLAFYPHVDCATLTHPIEDAESSTGRLELRIGAAEPGIPSFLSGILVVRPTEGPERHLSLRVPLDPAH